MKEGEVLRVMGHGLDVLVKEMETLHKPRFLAWSKGCCHLLGLEIRVQEE